MLVHLNGRLIPHDQARVSAFDRGFVFGDGVYEGLRSFKDPRRGRRVIAVGRHVRRLQAGLEECRIPWDAAALDRLSSELLDANGLDDAFLYWQITRGVPDLSPGPVRSRVPGNPHTPTVFGYCTRLPALRLDAAEPASKRASIQPDLRWSRGTLKSISLLGNVLAAIDAADGGAEEAILLREAGGLGPHRLLTEGTYTNVLLALPRPGPHRTDDPLDRFELATPSLESAPLLAGVTRDLLLAWEPRIVARAVTEAELHAAAEVLLLGTTTMVTSVTALDAAPVNRSEPGPVAKALLACLHRGLAHGADLD